MEAGREFALEDIAIVLQAIFGIVERAAKRAGGIEIDQGNGEFLDREPEGDRLHPELEGHGIAEFGDLDVLEAGDAIGFEAAEGVGESEAQFPIQFGGDEVIDAATVGGGNALPIEGLEVTAAGDDVEFTALLIESGCEGGDQFGLMLAIAVDGDEGVVVMGFREFKRGTKCSPVALIGIVGDDLNVGKMREPFRSTVGGPIIHDEDVLAIFPDLSEDGIQGGGLVIDRNGGQNPFFHENSLVVGPGDRIEDRASCRKSIRGVSAKAEDFSILGGGEAESIGMSPQDGFRGMLCSDGAGSGITVRGSGREKPA